MTTPRDTPLGTPSDALSMKAAAERAGVSVSTMRRRRDALISAGAEVSPSGWSIPPAAVDAVFDTQTQGVSGGSHDTPSDTPSDTPLRPPADTPSEQSLIEQLRSENEFLRQQVEQQARTIERQAEAHAVISAQLTQLGQLEAASPNEKPTRPRRRWWRRR